jgi:predicted DNA binding CopG/RHH family protein
MDKWQRVRKMSVRMTEDEYEQIEKKAAEYGLTISDYMRLVGKTAIIEVKAGEK